MQASPIAASVGGKGVVIGAGKMGYVYELNQVTGKLIWRAAVGEHNGHDSDSANILVHRANPTFPLTYLPGSLGGVLSNMAVSGNTIYVCVVNLSSTIIEPGQIAGHDVGYNGSGAGEVEALNARTGGVEWDTKVPEMPVGAATVSNDLVFTTLYQGVLIGLDRKTGVIAYRETLPTSTNAPIAVAGDTLLVPEGGPTAFGVSGGAPQLVAYKTND